MVTVSRPGDSDRVVTSPLNGTQRRSSKRRRDPRPIPLGRSRRRGLLACACAICICAWPTVSSNPKFTRCTANSNAAASTSNRTCGCPKSGFRRTACRASRCRSSSRIRGCGNSSARMMGDVDGGDSVLAAAAAAARSGPRARHRVRPAQTRRLAPVFGPASARYPGTYRPVPSSRRHVLHVGHWYAQSHPTEDFAETFAVWLQPKARWRREYVDWPALDKARIRQHADGRGRRVSSRACAIAT